MSENSFISIDFQNVCHSWFAYNNVSNDLPVFPFYEFTIAEYFEGGVFIHMVRCCYGIYNYKVLKIATDVKDFLPLNWEGKWNNVLCCGEPVQQTKTGLTNFVCISKVPFFSLRTNKAREFGVGLYCFLWAYTNF